MNEKRGGVCSFELEMATAMFERLIKRLVVVIIALLVMLVTTNTMWIARVVL